MMGSTNDSTYESFSDIFPTSWDNFGGESLNIDGIFNSLGDASSTLAPSMHPDAKRLTKDAPSSSDSDQSLSPQHHMGLKKPSQMAAEPVTKARTGPGRIPRNRPKPQNMFSVWTQPQQMAPPPMMAPMGYPAGAMMTSPYLGAAEMMQGGSPAMMGAGDPYSWMQGRQQKRPSPFFGPAGSPSLLYNPYGAPMGSPPFGFQPAHMGAYPMYQPPSMKLPVQALHRPAEPASQQDSGIGMVAPLLIPAEMGKPKAGNAASMPSTSAAEVDPSAIPTAISSFLGGSADSSRVANMDMYVMTFKSFVKEESEIDYSNVTVLELKRLLRKYQLAAQGKKDDLIKMVKDVAGFLKQMPIFGEDGAAASADEAKEVTKNERAPESIANQAERNSVEDSMERYLA